MNHPLQTGLVRIRNLREIVVGAGFLITKTTICTCAHVVLEALGLPLSSETAPDTEVLLDFPFLDGKLAVAKVESWLPAASDGSGDIAILRLLSSAPEDARPTRLLTGVPLSGRKFEAYGFPQDLDFGVWADGILGHQLSNGLFQIETDVTGYRIQPGFSGTPVWDSQSHGVVGMVVAVARDSVTQVAFLIPNQAIQRLHPDLRLVDVRKPFAHLTDGLAGVPNSPLGGVELFLREYLGTPRTPAPFGGRQKQLDELDQWLSDPDHPYALMVAQAGRGKSALLAHWANTVAEQGRAHVAFVPVSIRFGTALKNNTFSLLGARLRYVRNIHTDFPRESDAWLAEIEGYLREAWDGEVPLLIVLDGLDEAADWTCGRDLTFPPQPGSGIKVLVSARTLAEYDAEEWLRRLGWRQTGLQFSLPQLDYRGVSEVLQSMGDPLAGLVPQVDVIEELFRLSEGDPLLVRLYVEALQSVGERAAFLTVDELKKLQPGLAAYFDRWWEDQRWQWGSSVPLKEPAVKVMLNVLACALGALSTEDLLALTSREALDTWALEEALQPLGRFVIGTGKTQGYVFSHPRLGQYFAEEKLSTSEKAYWEQRFLDYGRQTLEALISGALKPEQAPPYVVNHYGAHLERAHAKPEEFYNLVCEPWMRAWEALTGTYDGFLADMHSAWKHAQIAGAEESALDARGKAIALQWRYALIESSINSLTRNIPPKLIVALVRHDMWSPALGLAYAKQDLKTLTDLAEYLSEPLLRDVLPTLDHAKDQQTLQESRSAVATRFLALGYPDEAFAVARGIQSTGKYRAVFEALARGAPQMILSYAATLSDEDRQARILERIIPHLPDELMTEILEIVFTVKDDRARIMHLLPLLIPRLPQPLFDRVLEMGYASDIHWRAESLIPLLSRLALEDQITARQESLTAVRAIPEDNARAKTLVWLAPHMLDQEEPLRAEALALVRAVQDPKEQAELWLWLLPDLPIEVREEVMSEILAAIFALGKDLKEMEWQAKQMAELAPYLSRSLIENALEHAKLIRDPYHRTQAMGSLLVRLAQLGEPIRAMHAAFLLTGRYGKRDIWQPIMTQMGIQGHGQEALGKILESNPWQNYEYSEALGSLLPHLPETSIRELYESGLEFLQSNTSLMPDQLQRLVNLLAPYLPRNMLPETLARLRPIGNQMENQSIQSARIELAANLNRLGARDRASELVPPEAQQSRLFSAAHQLLTRGNVQGVMELIGAVEDPTARAQTLTSLIYNVPSQLRADLLSAALLAAHAIPEVKARIWALITLLPFSSDNTKDHLYVEVVKGADIIEKVEDHAQLLIQLAPFCPKTERQQWLAETRAVITQIDDEFERKISLARISPYLPEAERSRALTEAFAALREAPVSTHPGSIMAGLLQYVPTTEKPLMIREFLSLVESLPDKQERWSAFWNLQPPRWQANPDMQEKEQDILSWWAEGAEEPIALIRAARYLPEVRPELLRKARTQGMLIENPMSRYKLLAALATQLPEKEQDEVFAEALIAFEAIGKYDSLWQIVGDSITRLPEKFRGAILEAALPALQKMESTISTPWQIEQLLAKMAQQGHFDTAFAILATLPQEEWPEMKTQARSLVKAIIPELAKQGFVSEALEQARSIPYAYWKAEALGQIIPYLPEHEQPDVINEALQSAREITQDRSSYGGNIMDTSQMDDDIAARPRVLARLATHLPRTEEETVLKEALETAQNTRAMRNFGRNFALGGLLAHMVRRGFTEWAVEVFLEMERDTAWATALAELITAIPAERQLDVLKDWLEVARKARSPHERNSIIANQNPVIGTPFGMLLERPANDVSTATLILRSKLPLISKYKIWSERLHILASGIRNDVLQDIATQAPLMADLGGLEALSGIADSIPEAQKWFP